MVQSCGIQMGMRQQQSFSNDYLNLGEKGSFPSMFYIFDGKLYFIASTQLHGREIWSSDGTIQATMLLQDIFPGPDNGASSRFASSRGLLFFAGVDPDHGKELHASQICHPGKYGSTLTPKCSHCHRGQYNTLHEATSCKKWTDCNPGKYIRVHGNATSDRLCVPCAEGKFSFFSNAEYCEHFTTCTSTEYVANEPSADTDRKCHQCQYGQFAFGRNGNACFPILKYLCMLNETQISGNVATFCNFHNINATILKHYSLNPSGVRNPQEKHRLVLNAETLFIIGIVSFI